MPDLEEKLKPTVAEVVEAPVKKPRRRGRPQADDPVSREAARKRLANPPPQAPMTYEELVHRIQGILASGEAKYADLNDCLFLLSRSIIPEKAKNLYRDRDDKKVGPIEFVKAEYGRHLTGFFTKKDLRRLDRQLVAALDNWQRYHPGEALEINLPAIGDASQLQYSAEGRATRNDLVKRWDRLNRVSRKEKARTSES